MARLRVGLVHDWLTGFRGGERVLLHLARRFPDADLFTLIHEPGSVPAEIEARRIFTSPLDRFPGRGGHYRKLLPFFPWAIRRFDLRGYDLLISTSHAVAKSIRVPRGTPHLSYCFTPMRYVWDQADAYLGTGLQRRLASPLVKGLRRFDVATSGEDSVTRFVAISNDVAGRIRRHYGRSARVIPPPVDLSWIPAAHSPPEEEYLLVGGFVPYKCEQIVIEAFRRLDRRLLVVGDGPTRRRIERDSPSNVRFLGRVDDARLASLYQNCRALIYPQHEDFGLIAVEAQGAGRPVIGFGQGGLVDTVRPLREDPTSIPSQDPLDATGLFFEEQTPEAICAAIEKFEKVEAQFEPASIRRWAERFSPSRFDADIDDEIAAVLRPSTVLSHSKHDARFS
jgi:glycosyltransferase involved in cell wall biosynthesis